MALVIVLDCTLKIISYANITMNDYVPIQIS